MNIDKLREIIKSKGIFKKENTKNIICKCIYCGDHSDVNKQGHLYVSVNPEYPVTHCFLCNSANPLTKFIYDISGNKKTSEEIISKEELESAIQNKRSGNVNFIPKLDKYELPEIKLGAFKYKDEYIKKRSNNLKTPLDFDNLIFDFRSFFILNDLTDFVTNMIGENGVNQLQDKMVGFITKNNSMITCRNIDPKDSFKFRKLILQKTKHNMLDYVEFKGGNPNSNRIVLCEGVFDAIGEMSVNSLNLFEKVRLYAAGLSYSYPTLLKSVCFDNSLFEVDVVILSDRNIDTNYYKKFKTSSNHVINNMRIYYNNNTGGDFGSFPIKPIEVQLQEEKKKYYDYKRKSNR